MKDDRYELAERHGMSKEFIDWFFDKKKSDCGTLWFLTMAVMWEGWKGRNIEIDRLAAENTGLKQYALDCVNAVENWNAWADPEDKIQDALETPTTDRIVAGIKSDGVREFLKGSQLPYQIATILAGYDNVDNITLQTVIWSGHPPEPDGDVYHIEYVSRGDAIVREILKQLDTVKSD